MEEPRYRVYVIELDDSLRKGTDKPAVYVGYSAKSPAERFAQHLRGERASRHVRDHGVRLRPRLYRAYPAAASRPEAERLERHVADRLRRRGFTVYGGH
jgi:GIY-YIG catalytic domain-containing protein